MDQLFDRMDCAPHLPSVMSEIECIQRDFLALADPDLPDQVERDLDTLLLAFEHNADAGPASLDVEKLKSLRLTKYQHPVYQQEMAAVSWFVVSCFDNYEAPGGLHLEKDDLRSVPFGTVLSKALTGFVYDMEIFGKGAPKVPAVMLSQHCAQTSSVCAVAHEVLRQSVPQEIWDMGPSGASQEAVDTEAMAQLSIQALSAFHCDTPVSHAAFFWEADTDRLEPIRIMQSFLVAHEYSHICLQHRARRNPSVPLTIAPQRLERLAATTSAVSHEHLFGLQISGGRLGHFFGEQQDELDADLLA